MKIYCFCHQHLQAVTIGDSDVGDIVMLVTSLCWWLISDVGDRIIILLTFFVMLVIFLMYQIGHQYPESVTNISNLSQINLVSNIRHQHRCKRHYQKDTKISCILPVLDINVQFGKIPKKWCSNPKNVALVGLSFIDFLAKMTDRISYDFVINQIIVLVYHRNTLNQNPGKN